MKEKRKQRAASVLLSLVMAVAFLPFFGSQEAYAIEMRDNVVIDITNGIVELEGVEERAVDYTLWSMGDKHVIPMQMTTLDQNAGIYEELYDLDSDGSYDIKKWVDTHNDYLTLELLDTCSVYGTRTVNAADSWITEMSNKPGGYNGWEYLYKSVTFKISDKEVRDTYDMLLIEEPYTLTGAEAMAVQNLVIDLADNGSFFETSVTYQNNIPHARYDLDRNGSDDIYTVFDCNARTLYVEKLETCSVNEPKVFTLPEAAIARQVLFSVEQDYVYKSLTLVMLMPPGPPVMYIGDADVTLSKTAFTYNGKVQKPTIVKIGNMELVEDRDYTVKWSNASSKNAGTYTMTIEGMGNYAGTTKATYKIAPKAVTPTVTLSKTAFTYNGKTQKPTVTVKAGTTKLTASSYSVENKGRKSVGKGTVKVTLKGNYKGTKTVSYKINPKGTTLKSLAAGSRSFTAKWNKQAVQTTGYQIQYATNSTFTKGVKTVTIPKNTTLTKKVTKLAGAKKYYVRVRTYKTVSGVKYYSPWSAKKYVTTKK